jgi:NAD(P)H-dependent FMN reductase
LEITLILSSVRDNRLADRVYARIKALIGDRFSFTTVDPLEYDLPLLNKRYFEMKDPEEKFRKLHDIFSKTDGFILVTAEYNHSIPPALSNLLDHFGDEFKYKACGIVSYSNGAIGGARCTEHLRLLCATLGMPPIPISPAWGLANKAGTPEGKSFEDNFERVFNLFIPQLLWYTSAYINQRKISA